MSSDYHSEIAGVVNADELQVGKGVVIEDGVLITGEGPTTRMQPSLKFLTWRSKLFVVDHEYTLSYPSKIIVANSFCPMI